jgi:RNA polymerase sigma-70 factor (ECF subfamily)
MSDAGRLAPLIDRHAAALVLYARQWTRSPEDVVQTAFGKLAGLRVWPGDPAGYLFRMVRHAAIDAGRAERRRTRREHAAAKPEGWFQPGDGLDAAAAVAALDDLPPDQREVIVARLWGGRTLDDIAGLTGCSVSTAHRRYEAGIRTLRERLGEA